VQATFIAHGVPSTDKRVKITTGNLIVQSICQDLQYFFPTKFIERKEGVQELLISGTYNSTLVIVKNTPEMTRGMLMVD